MSDIMNAGDLLWVEATRDAEAEHETMVLTAASVTAAPLWATVVAAESDADFHNRIALLEAPIEAIASSIAPMGTPDHSLVVTALPAQWYEDWKLAFEARQAESQRANAPRAFERSQQRAAAKTAKRAWGYRDKDGNIRAITWGEGDARINAKLNNGTVVYTDLPDGATGVGQGVTWTDAPEAKTAAGFPFPVIDSMKLLADKTLDEVDNWYRQGVITQDQFEAYMHVWAEDPSHAGYGPGAGWTDKNYSSPEVAKLVEEFKAITGIASKTAGGKPYHPADEGGSPARAMEKAFQGLDWDDIKAGWAKQDAEKGKTAAWVDRKSPTVPGSYISENEVNGLKLTVWFTQTEGGGFYWGAFDSVGTLVAGGLGLLPSTNTQSRVYPTPEEAKAAAEEFATTGQRTLNVAHLTEDQKDDLAVTAWLRKRAGGLDAYWQGVDASLAAMRKAKSAAEVIEILGAPDRNIAVDDAFFGGDGDEMLGALFDAGWRSVRIDAPYYWCLEAPDGSEISYVEGDVFTGNKLASKTAGLPTDWSKGLPKCPDCGADAWTPLGENGVMVACRMCDARWSRDVLKSQSSKTAAADPPNIALARRVVETQTFDAANGLDLFSASAIVQVYDALNDANKAKFGAMSLPAMVDIAFKLGKSAKTADNSFPPKDDVEDPAAAADPAPAAPGAPQPAADPLVDVATAQVGGVIMEPGDGVVNTYEIKDAQDAGDSMLLTVTKNGTEEMQLQIPKTEKVQIHQPGEAKPKEDPAAATEAPPAAGEAEKEKKPFPPKSSAKTAADPKSLSKGDRVWWHGEDDKVLKGTYVGPSDSGVASGFTQSDAVQVEKDGGGTVNVGAQDLVKGEPPSQVAASKTALNIDGLEVPVETVSGDENPTETRIVPAAQSEGKYKVEGKFSDGWKNLMPAPASKEECEEWLRTTTLFGLNAKSSLLDRVIDRAARLVLANGNPYTDDNPFSGDNAQSAVLDPAAGGDAAPMRDATSEVPDPEKTRD